MIVRQPSGFAPQITSVTSGRWGSEPCAVGSTAPEGPPRNRPHLWMSEMSIQAQAQPPTTYVFSSEPQQPPAEHRRTHMYLQTTSPRCRGRKRIEKGAVSVVVKNEKVFVGLTVLHEGKGCCSCICNTKTPLRTRKVTHWRSYFHFETLYFGISFVSNQQIMFNVCYISCTFKLPLLGV